MTEPLQIRSFTSSGFAENAYLVRCSASGAAAVVDPGSQVDDVVATLDAENIDIEAILLTHAHLDHLEGVAELARQAPVPIHLHSADRPLYDAAAQQGAMFGHRFEEPPPPDASFEDGGVYRFGECDLEIRHVPGHSPGHVLLYNAAAGVAFVGDVVFAGSIGRTDLPGGDYQQLMRSIRERVLTLPDETALYCGHGPVTTVERERRTNPFLIPHFGGSRA